MNFKKHNIEDTIPSGISSNHYHNSKFLYKMVTEQRHSKLGYTNSRLITCGCFKRQKERGKNGILGLTDETENPPNKTEFSCPIIYR